MVHVYAQLSADGLLAGLAGGRVADAVLALAIVWATKRPTAAAL